MAAAVIAAGEAASATGGAAPSASADPRLTVRDKDTPLKRQAQNQEEREQTLQYAVTYWGGLDFDVQVISRTANDNGWIVTLRV